LNVKPGGTYSDQWVLQSVVSLRKNISGGLRSGTTSLWSYVRVSGDHEQ